MKWIGLIWMVLASTMLAGDFESKAATEVANYATELIRSMDEQGDVFLQIALKLDPSCEQALRVKGILKHKLRPEPVKGMTKEQLVRALAKGGRALIGGRYEGNKNAQQVAALCLATALLLDEKNREVILDLTKLESRGQEVGLDKLLKLRSVTVPNAPTPMKRPDKAPADAVQFNGHWYAYVRVRVDWRGSRANAATLGGELASITSKEEADFLAKKFANGRHNVWIGGFKNNGWHWLSGEKFGYSNWLSGGDKGPFLYLHKGGQWGACGYTPSERVRSKISSDFVGYICEWE